MIRHLLLALLWALPASAQQIIISSPPPCIVNCTLTNPTITGGTINNTVIGGTTPAAGTFSTITSNGSLAIANGAAGLTSTFDYFTSTGQGGPQLRLSSNNGGFNTLVLQNLNSGNAFSSLAFNRYDGYEKGAVGLGQPGAGNFADTVYIEGSHFPYDGATAPSNIAMVQTGRINGSNQQVVKYKIASDGGQLWYDNTGARQMTLFNGNSGGNNYVSILGGTAGGELDVTGSVVSGLCGTGNRTKGLLGDYAQISCTPATSTGAGLVARWVKDTVVKGDWSINTTPKEIRLTATDVSGTPVVLNAPLGAGGSWTLTAIAGLSGNVNGGDINLTPGAKAGSGRNGAVVMYAGSWPTSCTGLPTGSLANVASTVTVCP